jgi:hypothetical protein
MPASTPQEIQFLFERASNIGDIEAILALYEPGAVLVAGGKPVPFSGQPVICPSGILINLRDYFCKADVR